MRTHFNIDLRVAPLSKNLPRRTYLDVLWATLTAQLDAGRVAIVGLSGRDEHWTVAVSATASALRLCDSGGRRQLRRSSCAVVPRSNRYGLDRREVFVLRLAARVL